jgi:hypothetical protein
MAHQEQLQKHDCATDGNTGHTMLKLLLANPQMNASDKTKNWKDNSKSIRADQRTNADGRLWW